MPLRHPSWDLARVVATETFATLRAGCWPAARLHRLPKARPEPGRRPVLLVHGYLGHPDMLRPLARRLLEDGVPEVVRPGYASTRCSLEDIVRTIGAAARPFHSDGPIDLVGHSLGAVASRAWLKEFGGDRWVRRFVSLGGPHAGTAHYWLTPGPVRAVLDPDGTWVRQLNQGPEPVPTVVVRARYDHQVFPPERGSIAGVREVVIGGRGHNGLLWSRDAHDAVLAALRAPTEEAELAQAS